MRIQGQRFEIVPVGEDELGRILDVYCQCADFLALGPEPTASQAMVVADLQHSRQEGGVFCGIIDSEGEMIGVVDFVPAGFGGDPRQAFFSLLMIAPPHRNRGLGAEAVRLVEEAIGSDAQVECILSAVQVNNPAGIRFWQRNGYAIVGGPERQPDQTTVYRLRKAVRERR